MCGALKLKNNTDLDQPHLVISGVEKGLIIKQPIQNHRHKL